MVTKKMIWISDEAGKVLDDVKVHPRESYAEAFDRIVKEWEEVQK